MSLSQRFDQFKMAQAKKLQHGSGMEDPDEDPDCPADEPEPIRAPPRKAASRTLKAAPRRPVVDLTLDPWDEDENVQVVPDDDSKAPKKEPVIEFSKYPKQPTIRNFFKPEPPASPPPNLHACACDTPGFASTVTNSTPSSRFDLDDSWDWDILIAAEGCSFEPCMFRLSFLIGGVRNVSHFSYRVPAWLSYLSNVCAFPPALPIPYIGFVPGVKSTPEPENPRTPPRTDRENWAGCWDINFDIGSVAKSEA